MQSKNVKYTYNKKIIFTKLMRYVKKKLTFASVFK